MIITEYDIRRRKDTLRYYIVRVKTIQCREEYTIINTPKSIVEFMEENYKMSLCAEEQIYLVTFNVKCRVTGVFMLSKGTLNCSLVDVRGVFMRAVLINAASILLVHNHPSGDITPSSPDLSLTKRIKDAGELMGIPLADHVVIGDSFLSFREKNLL